MKRIEASELVNVVGGFETMTGDHVIDNASSWVAGPGGTFHGPGGSYSGPGDTVPFAKRRPLPSGGV